MPGNRNGLIHPSSSQRIPAPQPSLNCRDCWNFLFYSLNSVFVVVVVLGLLFSQDTKLKNWRKFCCFHCVLGHSFSMCSNLCLFSHLGFICWIRPSSFNTICCHLQPQHSSSLELSSTLFFFLLRFPSLNLNTE